MAKKVKLEAAFRLLAMPKPKKEAESRVIQLSETLFEHVMKLVLFGLEVEASKKWMKEVRDKCMRMQNYASDTTNKHLDPKWVFEQIFTDFAKTPDRFVDTAAHIIDYNDEYTGRFVPASYEDELWIECAQFFKKLSKYLVDRDYRFGQQVFYDELLKFIARFSDWQ